jgi:hypothetical protein
VELFLDLELRGALPNTPLFYLLEGSKIFFHEL